MPQKLRSDNLRVSQIPLLFTWCRKTRRGPDALHCNETMLALRAIPPANVDHVDRHRSGLDKDESCARGEGAGAAASPTIKL
jgi:hypothetical protein